MSEGFKTNWPLPGTTPMGNVIISATEYEDLLAKIKRFGDALVQIASLPSCPNDIGVICMTAWRGMSRDQLIAYFDGRTDQPLKKRKELIAKIRAASDESIRSDKPCEGKHWWIMDFDSRNVCPYCGWKLTRV